MLYPSSFFQLCVEITGAYMYIYMFIYVCMYIRCDSEHPNNTYVLQIYVRIHVFRFSSPIGSFTE